ncbi:MAG: hypothetical protein ACI3WQ_07435 [Faecousia sp.]
MKRWIALGIVLVALVVGLLFLGEIAIDPGAYTGEWYGAEDGRLYHFHEGIITCPEDTHTEGEEFCGAYFFCRDRIILFVVDPSGASQVRELYPAGDPKGEFLCEDPNGTGRIAFSRSNIALQAENPE